MNDFMKRIFFTHQEFFKGVNLCNQLDRRFFDEFQIFMKTFIEFQIYDLSFTPHTFIYFYD